MVKRTRMPALCAVLAAALAYGIFVYTEKKEEPIAHAGTAPNAAVEPGSLTCRGREYPMKDLFRQFF